jgi:hypothetical protein
LLRLSRKSTAVAQNHIHSGAAPRQDINQNLWTGIEAPARVVMGGLIANLVLLLVEVFECVCKLYVTRGWLFRF